MDIHSLALRLQSLDEQKLRELYNQLYETCTGRRLETSLELIREIAIIETTDVERGAMHYELLGEAENLNEKWQPGSRCSMITSDTRVRYESNPELRTPQFYRENRIFPSCSLGEKDAALEILSGKLDHSSSIAIAANFQKFPAGWSLWSLPSVSPRKELVETDLHIDEQSFWILVCRNYAVAKNLLSKALGHPPILAIIDEPGIDDPTHLGNIRIVEKSKAYGLLREFCERSELFSTPQKPQMIESICKMQTNASDVINQRNAEKIKISDLHLTLRKAKNSWDRLFIDERDSAIKALQLQVVAHPMQKTLMIMRGEREAHVNRYISKRLLPLVKNFIERECIELEISNQKSKLNTSEINGKVTSENVDHLRAGFLYALPSIGLLLPNIPIPLPNLIFADKNAESISMNTIDFTANSFGSITTNLRNWYEKGKEKLKEELTEILSAPLEQISGNMEKMNQGIATILGMLVTGQVAVVVGLAIGAVITIRGSMSLREAENMIDDILRKTESMWPQIEDSLQSLVPAFNGVVDDETFHRAKKVLDQINHLQS